MKVDGGSQPIRTDRDWFLMYHGVETRATMGPYRTFWALLDLDDPSRILRLEDEQPVLEANPDLTRPIARQMYLPTPVVFTTGVADAGDHYIVASGEVDLACRITNMPKALFA
jgi:beta-1,2-mannobiose phosphorylase / 1,2-beta-oligomannan phosphorylase